MQGLERARDMISGQSDAQSITIAGVEVAKSAPASLHYSRPSERAINAIDGGSAALYVRSSLLVGLIRTAHVIAMPDMTHKRIERKEALVIVSVDNDTYRIESHGDIMLSLTHPIIDREHVPIERMLEYARTMAERLAIPHEGLVLCDGSLTTRFPDERITHRKDLFGVCKSSQFTGSRSPEVFFGAMQGVFAYTFEGFSFVKLHDRARFAFRIDGDLSQDTFDTLVDASKDAAFLGYPYHLILADRFAKVSMEELRKYRLLLESRTGSFSGDVHSVLDSINI